MRHGEWKEAEGQVSADSRKAVMADHPSGMDPEMYSSVMKISCKLLRNTISKGSVPVTLCLSINDFATKREEVSAHEEAHVSNELRK